MSKNAQPKRINLSQKIRFEVFKRDSFTCQYCGRKAPGIVLQCDHIEPVSKGGTNDILNLITSCFDCNIGKGNRRLSENAVIEKRQRQLAELQERKEQIEMVFLWQKELINLDSEIADRFVGVWKELTSGYNVNAAGRQKLLELKQKFSVEEVLKAMRIAAIQYIKYEDGEPSGTSVFFAWEKIGGICYNLRKSKENPMLAKSHYIRGILRNRLRYTNEYKALSLIKTAIRLDVDIDDLEEFTKTVNTWTQWRGAIESYIENQEAGDE